MTSNRGTGTDPLLLAPTRRTYALIAASGSKIVAALTVILAAVVIFTDVTFASFGTVKYTSTLAVMLVATYLMYFSLEDAGERLGEDTEQYKASLSHYDSVRGKIKPEAIPDLREFCTRYAKEELEFRRRCILASGGLTEGDLEAYLSGKKYPRAAKIILRRAARERVGELSPAVLLSGGAPSSPSELKNPERARLQRLALRLLPSSLCMLFTVSLALTAKEGLTASAVLDGIFKLAALPLAGFRGYKAGYVFARYSRTAWLETKTRILEAFLKDAGGAAFAPKDSN